MTVVTDPVVKDCQMNRQSIRNRLFDMFQLTTYAGPECLEAMRARGLLVALRRRLSLEKPQIHLFEVRLLCHCIFVLRLTLVLDRVSTNSLAGRTALTDHQRQLPDLL